MSRTLFRDVRCGTSTRPIGGMERKGKERKRTKRKERLLPVRQKTSMRCLQVRSRNRSASSHAAPCGAMPCVDDASPVNDAHTNSPRIATIDLSTRIDKAPKISAFPNPIRMTMKFNNLRVLHENELNLQVLLESSTVESYLSPILIKKLNVGK